jgi:hypothetical protein
MSKNNEWIFISKETMPKNDTEVLLGHWNNHFIQKGWYNPELKKWFLDGDISYPVNMFTHWQPLPSIPKKGIDMSEFIGEYSPKEVEDVLRKMQDKINKHKEENE